MNPLSFPHATALAAGAVAVAAAAAAAEAQTVIGQASVASGELSIGGGFPLRTVHSGHGKLASDLVVSAGVTGGVVEASNVTRDLRNTSVSLNALPTHAVSAGGDVVNGVPF